MVDFDWDELGVQTLLSAELRASTDGGAGGLGLFAGASASAGDVLLRIPLGACLSLANPRVREDEDMMDLLAELTRGESVCNLALVVAMEMAARPTTALEPWLERWPAATEGSLGWAEDGPEWAAISGGPGEGPVRVLHAQHVEMATKVWAHVIQPRIARAAAGEGEGASSRLGKVTEERWLYAVSMVLSRALDLRVNDESQLAIVPLIDMLNHTASDMGSCRVRFDPASQAFELVAAAPIAAGDELRICYGRKGNEELLACYGFALQTNRFDRLGLSVPFGRPDQPQILKMTVLAMLPSAYVRRLEGQPGSSRSVDVYLTWDEERREALIADEIVLLLRLCVLGVEDLTAIPRALQGQPVTADAEARAWALLASKCKDWLEARHPEPEGPASAHGGGSIDVFNEGLKELVAAGQRLAQRRVEDAASLPHTPVGVVAEDQDYDE
jgi:hypothetical protein